MQYILMNMHIARVLLCFVVPQYSMMLPDYLVGALLLVHWHKLEDVNEYATILCGKHFSTYTKTQPKDSVHTL